MQSNKYTQGKEESKDSTKAPGFHFAVFLHVLESGKSELISIPVLGWKSLTSEVSDCKLWVYLNEFSQKSQEHLPIPTCKKKLNKYNLKIYLEANLQPVDTTETERMGWMRGGSLSGWSVGIVCTNEAIPTWCLVIHFAKPISHVLPTIAAPLIEQQSNS